jgi:hypothetical protein
MWKVYRAGSICTAGPLFAMHRQPNRRPTGITFWVSASDEWHSDMEGQVIGSSYGDSIKPTKGDHRASNGTIESLMGRNLLVGNTEQHSAKELCGSPTSWTQTSLTLEPGPSAGYQTRPSGRLVTAPTPLTTALTTS